MSKAQAVSKECKSISLEEKRIIKQIRDWKYFLNNTIGLFSFTFAISCAGIEPKKSILWNFLSIAVIMCLIAQKNHIFPEIIRVTRNKKDKYREQAVLALKRGLRLCGNITRLGEHSGITRQTLTSIARGKACSHATRLKLEAFIEEQEQRKGRPFKGAQL